MEWIHQAQITVQWWTFVKRVINFQVPQDQDNSVSNLRVQPTFASLCDPFERCRMLQDTFKNISQTIKADRS